MTRAYIGLALLDITYLASGYALLYGLGLARSRRDALRYAGLALFAGWALVGTGLALAVTFGLDPTVGSTLVLALVLVAAGLVIGRLFPSLTLEPLPRERATFVRFAAALGGVLIAIGLGSALAIAVRSDADANWDVWAFWLAKAKAIYYFGGLDTGVGGFTAFANPDYPPLAPTVAATTFHFMGGAHPALLPLQQCVLGIAFVAGMLALLVAYVPRWLLFPSFAMLVLSPLFRGRLGSVLPDQTVGYFIAAATVGCVLWLDERRPAWLGFSVVFLSAAALTKNEGRFLGAVLVVATLVASLVVHRRRGLFAFVLVLGPAVVVSWKLWLNDHGLGSFQGNYSWSRLVDVDYLISRGDRLEYAAGELAQFVCDGDSWLLVLPLAIVALVVAASSLPAPTAVLSAWLVVGFAGLLATYWIGIPDVHWYVETSGRRVVGTLPLVAGTVFPLLLGLVLARESRRVNGLESRVQPASE